MNRSRTELVELLLARVAKAETVFIHADRLNQWPSECSKELLRAGLLQSAGEVNWIECRHCTRRCNRPVIQRTLPSGSPPLSFTTCDLRDDVSIVAIERKRLRRWRTGRAAFARFVGSELGLRIRDSDYETGRIIYQSARFAGIRTAVALIFAEGRAQLRLDTEARPLDELIVWHSGPPRINWTEIELWCAELATTRIAPISTLPSRLKHIRRKARYEDRNAGWQEHADVLKQAAPHRKKSDIADEIFRSQRWAGVRSSKTIERVIRLPK